LLLSAKSSLVFRTSSNAVDGRAAKEVARENYLKTEAKLHSEWN